MKYRVRVFGSVLEWSHGVERTIKEIFIPEKGIIFNMADGEFHVFRGERERSNEEKEEVEVDDRLVKLLETHLKTKDECQAKAKNLLKE